MIDQGPNQIEVFEGQPNN